MSDGDIRGIIEAAMQAAESEALREGSIPGYSMWSHAILEALRSSGYAVIALPEPTGSKDGDDYENGFVEWDYPHGSVHVFDDGVIGWHQWHFDDPSKLRAAAAALLAAAHRSESVVGVLPEQEKP